MILGSPPSLPVLETNEGMIPPRHIIMFSLNQNIYCLIVVSAPYWIIGKRIKYIVYGHDCGLERGLVYSMKI